METSLVPSALQGGIILEGVRYFRMPFVIHIVYFSLNILIGDEEKISLQKYR